MFSEFIFHEIRRVVLGERNMQTLHFRCLEGLNTDTQILECNTHMFVHITTSKLVKETSILYKAAATDRGMLLSTYDFQL